MLLDVTGTRVKIGDFGLSKNLKFSKLTARRATYAYMAPELINVAPRLFDEEIDLFELNLYKADIYSLGVTFWEILCRKPPFDGLSPVQICQKVEAGERPSMDNFIWEKEIHELIEKSWIGIPYERCSLLEYIYTLNTVLQTQRLKRVSGLFSTMCSEMGLVEKNALITEEPINFRDLLPVPRRAVVDLLIEQNKWPVLKEFISAESQEVQQAFEIFMKSVDKSAEHASIWYSQLPSEEMLALDPLQLEVVNETDHAKKEDTKDESKPIISDSTLLHIAAKKGYVEMVKLLLQDGDIVDSRDIYLCTPLHLAAEEGNQVVDVLLGAGASVSLKDKNGWTPLHFAARNNHSESARVLLKHRAPIDAIDVIGSTPLHFAVLHDHEPMIKLLLDHNADPNACDCDGRTPLYIACSEDMIEVVKLLLQYKATIEITDQDGWSPLHFACCEGAINCVIYLLERGANPNTTDNNGSTALYSATLANHADVVQILIQYGAIEELDNRAREAEERRLERELERQLERERREYEREQEREERLRAHRAELEALAAAFTSMALRAQMQKN